jgi:S-adenosylmethionine:tRNA ribosyltransferase-isomerase
VSDRTADYDYDLPEAAIAQQPVEPRDAARLLVATGDEPRHLHVRDLPSLVGPGDVVVLNTTRVLPARLRLRKPTGGAVEVLLLEPVAGDRWQAMVRPGRRVAPGTVLEAGPDLAVEVGEHLHDGLRAVHVRPGPEGLLAALDRHGEIPLPPYIHETLADPERYQTVFADRPESVAAPTAGLHLTPAVLDGCRAAGARIETVVLAVGLGTFKPITAERVADHPMHAERYRVPRATLDACAAADRVVAVGTTVVRALESAAATGEPEGSTDLFIRPGHEFRVVDALLTNFHLPRSSLLVLFEAFYGPAWRDLYALARQEGYRFLSFGDAMLLARNLHADVAIAT